MASEADFSDLVVMERAVEITFLPTGDRLSFARFGALLSPGHPISPPNFGLDQTWEVVWLARNLAQKALLRHGQTTPGERRLAREKRRAAAPPPATPADEPEHVRLLHDLARATTHDELSLHYQPICDVQTRTIVGQEALGRWTHPVRGAIEPAEFIPLAEGLGRDRRDWPLGARSRAGRGRHLEGALARCRQSVARAVPAGRSGGDVRATLDRHQLPGHRLQLELTEGVLIDDTSRALNVLRALKQLGVAIALDDFGTGYSNLTYLRVLPIDRIKIDKSFVQDLGTSRQVEAIVRAIIGIGQALGLEVTAEGVETETQLEFLRAQGCAHVQGFLLGQPRPGPLRPAPGVAPQCKPAK